MVVRAIQKKQYLGKWGESVQMILKKCSKYSLQVYLFNGFILTAVRIVLCNVMKVPSPFMIVAAITIIDVSVTLLLCEYVLHRIPVIRTICGLEKKKKEIA